MELRIDGLTKQYPGSVRPGPGQRAAKNRLAVDHISLKLHEGVYGLLGANGALQSFWNWYSFRRRQGKRSKPTPAV